MSPKSLLPGCTYKGVCLNLQPWSSWLFSSFSLNVFFKEFLLQIDLINVYLPIGCVSRGSKFTFSRSILNFNFNTRFSLLFVYLKTVFRLLVLSRRPRWPLNTDTFLNQFLSSITHRYNNIIIIIITLLMTQLLKIQ